MIAVRQGKLLVEGVFPLMGTWNLHTRAALFLTAIGLNLTMYEPE